VLYFVSAELALGYWLFAFLSALGALQWVATRYRLGGLAFFDCSISRVRGYVLAVLLVAGGAAGFFLSQWQAIFAPGPAGSELAVLFATSAISALVVTLALPVLLERWRRGPGPGAGGDGGQPVIIGHATGQLYMPPGPTTLAPAVCLLPACPVGLERAHPEAARRVSLSLGRGITSQQPAAPVEARSMAILARRLAAEGVVALVVNPDEHSYAYPAMLAILPAAVAMLRERPEIDPNRIGALGEDLGADLVIRAASTSKEIKAVAALAPILMGVPPDLGLLHELSYYRAMCWARDRRRATLGKELNAVEYATKIPPRPFLLLYGEDDKLVGEIDIATASRCLLGETPLANQESTPLAPGRDGISPAVVRPALRAGSVGRESTSRLQVIPGLGHLNLAAHPTVMQVVSQWLKEHL
jgi:dienelactone hydrolase